MGYLAEQNTQGETLSEKQLDNLGIKILKLRNYSGYYCIEKTHITKTGIEKVRYYDRRWIATTLHNLEADKLFPNKRLAIIATSIRLGKGEVL